MQIFYPWGKENSGILLDKNILEQLKELSQQCESYYFTGIEKRRNGSQEETNLLVELKDEILNKLEQISEQIKNQQPVYALILDNPFMKQSLIAALIAHTLDFDYRILQTIISNGKYEVRGAIRDRSGYHIESIGMSDPFDSSDMVQSMGAFFVASKKAFISSVAQLSELDLISKVTEVLI